MEHDGGCPSVVNEKRFLLEDPIPITTQNCKKNPRNVTQDERVPLPRSNALAVCGCEIRRFNNEITAVGPGRRFFCDRDGIMDWLCDFHRFFPIQTQAAGGPRTS